MRGAAPCGFSVLVYHERLDGFMTWTKETNGLYEKETVRILAVVGKHMVSPLITYSLSGLVQETLSLEV